MVLQFVLVGIQKKSAALQVVVVVVGAVARRHGPVNPGVDETPRNTGAHPLA